jgi:checkpoint serine/threonine-protein kinase
VNPKNGRSEHVFVNLEALYPTPNVNGTELCFEELMAGHRGWLDKVWKPEAYKKLNGSPRSQDETEESNVSIDNISRDVSEKLVIARDPETLDENGAAKENGRQGKGRRMKIKEVNETQISKHIYLTVMVKANQKQ